MNQPKFRGFNLETKTWHFGYGWMKLHYSEEYKAKKGIGDKALLLKYGSGIECELISMGQFTGIRDIHKKEAYNGDLFYWHGLLRKIVYREDKGAFMATPVGKGYKSYFYLNDIADRFEIVGNVTEHSFPFNSVG